MEPCTEEASEDLLLVSEKFVLDEAELRSWKNSTSLTSGLEGS